MNGIENNLYREQIEHINQQIIETAEQLFSEPPNRELRNMARREILKLQRKREELYWLGLI